MRNFGTFEVCVNNWHYGNCKQISANVPDYRMFEDVKEYLERRDMTPNEELFATYYNRGKILVRDMDDTSLREHREQLRQIATEAKAQLVAADDEVRERSAKKSLKDKEWLVTNDLSHSVTESINVVKTRQARMSKMDKLQNQLIAAGIDDATVKEMVKNLERKATDKNLKTVTFRKPTSEPAAVQVVKAKPDENAEPFNPANLFGKKE